MDFEKFCGRVVYEWNPALFAPFSTDSRPHSLRFSFHSFLSLASFPSPILDWFGDYSSRSHPPRSSTSNLYPSPSSADAIYPPTTRLPSRLNFKTLCVFVNFGLGQPFRLPFMLFWLVFKACFWFVFLGDWSLPYNGGNWVVLLGFFLVFYCFLYGWWWGIWVSELRSVSVYWYK